ncbi:hypothetical protein J7T55_015603 [Diaporthe amygdali]|uniref:uncharacterized protein n=1 Tax=Phomopsis amygdali TaxID=1214568 RepID=UPI0022FE7CC2|nr:uncharacterized protein J7T55_015603 [Diaporthe amygdali]KAJ0120868.1 hypothetical protein J7T55_015603 [Diaporthe amygdali]
MDSLVAAMWHNENLSMLHSLPDDVVIKIIGMLSNSGIDCIRRVARRFPPLCVREVLSPLRGSNPTISETGPFYWPCFEASSYLRPQFLELVDRDEYCNGCQAARKSLLWEQRLHNLTKYMHCSACAADHPACLFSESQRRKPARLRRCIAHEGYIRICGHPEGVVRLPQALNLKRKQLGRLRSDAATKIQCRDPSHVVQCSSVQRKDLAKPYSPGCRARVCTEYYQSPTVSAHEQIPNQIDIQWTTHVPFNGQMDALRPKLLEIRENAGKYIFPCPMTAKENPELRCFDPNDCHCTVYKGAENVRWEWKGGSWRPGRTKCISDPARRLDSLQPSPSFGRTPSAVVRGIARSLKTIIAPKCPAVSRRHQSRAQHAPRAYSKGACFVDVKPCHASKNCLVVDYMRSLVVCEDGKLYKRWYNALDPSSYNITADQDGLGMYWCWQPHCRNYFKGVPNYAGILRGLEFRKECQHYDCQ